MPPDFILRPLHIADADTFARHADNALIAMNMRDAFPHPYRTEDAVNFINMVHTNNPKGVRGIELNGEICGAIGIHPKDDVYRKSAEIGYWVSEEFWGQGIATEALKLTIPYAFKTFEVERLFGCVFSVNIASQKVMEKAGFTLEGRLKRAVFKNEQYYDELIYSLLRQG